MLQQILRQLLSVYTSAFPVSEDNPPPQLILVPGPEDPVTAPSHILPRPSLPIDLISDNPTNPTNPHKWLRLASNPCRIRVYTREIVVFRAEYTRLLVRHCVHLPTFSNTGVEGEPTQVSESDQNQTEVATEAGIVSVNEENNQLQNNTLREEFRPKVAQSTTERLGVGLARCLASQSHLLPLLGHIAPVYWAWDQALSLNPLPNLVVAVEPNALADLNAATNHTQTGNCLFVNPGQFGSVIESTGVDVADRRRSLRTEYAFKVYYPLTGLIENSCLPE